MKGKINLLYKARNYKKKERFFERFRKITIIFGAGVFLVLSILLYMQSMVGQQYKNLLSQKEELIRSSLPKKEAEQKLLFIQDRTRKLENFKAERTFYKNYYDFIAGIVPQSSASAQLSDFSIDKKNNFSATIAFVSLSEALTVLDVIEDAQFIDGFSSVKVEQVSIAESQLNQTEKILVTITGTVKERI